MIILFLCSFIAKSQTISVSVAGKFYFDLSKCSFGVVCVKKDSLWHYGSGFIIIDSASIITAYHGVRNADSIFYKACGELVPLTINKLFADRDIALLKADRPISKPFQLGLYSDLRLNDTVVIIGFDNGLSISNGTVVRIYREKENVQLLRFRGYAQSGFSGGPVLNLKGEVVGVILRGNEMNANIGQSEGVAIYIDFIYD